MREILFRGRDYEGRWNYGSLRIIKFATGDPATMIQANVIGEISNEVIVDPKTVGQYIGILDVNGNRIFEGDRVYFITDATRLILEVVFDDCCWMLSDPKNANYKYQIRKNDQFYVVGNIHDMKSEPEKEKVEIVRCKDCMHAPEVEYKKDGTYDGFDVKFPDDICPLNCSDPYYRKKPSRSFFCAYGKLKTKNTN